jgi:hypothetical protein
MAVFGTYETLKTVLCKKFPDVPKMAIYLPSAILGDMMGSLVLTPGEVISRIPTFHSHTSLKGCFNRLSSKRFKRDITGPFSLQPKPS